MAFSYIKCFNNNKQESGLQKEYLMPFKQLPYVKTYALYIFIIFKKYTPFCPPASRPSDQLIIVKTKRNQIIIKKPKQQTA